MHVKPFHFLAPLRLIWIVARAGAQAPRAQQFSVRKPSRLFIAAKSET
jgi:hypothetical protein